MDEGSRTRYWCHMCSQMVNPIMEADQLKCPFCCSGFVEEMESTNIISRSGLDYESEFSSSSDHRALSLWAPILLGIMGNPHRRPRFSRNYFLDDDEEDDDDDNNGEREINSIIQRRRRSSATILQLLQTIRSGIVAEAQNHVSRNLRYGENRESVIFINPSRPRIINQNLSTFGSLGDYFIGPGLDLLLQHLSENDPNRYGTPPALKEVVEELPIVKIKENLQCPVCLDDFSLEAEAKEMPCKHKFHGDCLLPWLQLHSSCPVCRYQLPTDLESKFNAETSTNGNILGEAQNISINGDHGVREAMNESSDRTTFALPWPFSTLFSSPFPSETIGNSTSMSSASSSSSSAPDAASHTDRN